MGEKKVKPPKLPSGAPRELKDFLACKIMEVDLDPANASWLPKPEIVPDGLAPTVTPTPTGANALSVTVGWGFVSVTLPVTVTDGQLHVDATGMPGKQATDDWVRTFNDSLKSNDKELSGLEIKNGKIHLTKRAIPAAATETPPTTTLTPPPVTTPPVTTPAVTTPAATDSTPKDESADGTKLKPGCLIGIIMALVLVMGAGAAILLRDDSKKTPAAQATTTASRASTTTLEPIDEKEICANLAILEQVLADFGTDDPCTIDPDDFWDACEEAYLPCFKNSLPLVVLNPMVGITHAGSVPDSATGQTGPSQAEHSVSVVGPLGDPTAAIEVTSQCDGDTLTGRTTIAAGITAVKHPLVSFGACSAQVYYATTAGKQTIGSYDYTVSDAAIAAGQPITDGITVPTESTLNAAGTTLGFLGGKSLDPMCTWFNAQGYPLGFTGCAGDRWSFNSAHGDARIASYGAGWINPIGVAAPTLEQMAPFGASRLFGPGTLFPCGLGHFGYTACPTQEAAVETSAFVAGTVSWSTRLDEMPVGTYVEVGVEEYWLRLLRDTSSWTLTSSEGDDSQSRAILRGNAITFMIPYDEAAAPDLVYTVKVGDDTGEVTQTPQPVLGLVTSTQGPETPSDFFMRLSESIATGDLTYALDRLHPLVLEAFPGDVCRTELSLRIRSDYRIAFESVGETAPWTWELPDGRTFELAEATTVSIVLPDNTDPVDAHIVNIDRMYYWFTVCDGR